MGDINGIKIEPKINLSFGKQNKPKKAGNGGQIFIFSREITGGGKIKADGGNGEIPGDGGKVHVETELNNFNGEVSANGGQQVK